MSGDQRCRRPRLLDKALLRRTDYTPVIAAVRVAPPAAWSCCSARTAIVAEDSEFGLTGDTFDHPRRRWAGELASVPWASEIVLVGDRISASRRGMGLVNRLVPSCVLDEQYSSPGEWPQRAVGDAQGEGGDGRRMACPSTRRITSSRSRGRNGD